MGPMVGHGTASLLLTAAVGDWVLERASTQKKNLKTIGQIVGAAIIIASFMGVACKVYSLSQCMKGGYYSPTGVFCPFTSQKPSEK